MLGNSKKVEEKLTKKIKELEKELQELKNELQSKPEDDISKARHALAKCTEYRNRSDETLSATIKLYNEIETRLNKILEKEKEVEEYSINIKNANTLSEETIQNISELDKKKEIIESIFSKKDEFEIKMTEVETLFSKSEDTTSKINAMYNTLKKKKDEVDSFYYELFGYEEEIDNNGEVDFKTVEGIKHQLEDTYQEISKDLQELKKDLLNLNKSSIEQYDNFIDEKEQVYKALVLKVESLLPNALTAGLSHAFYKKRRTEIREGKKLSEIFNYSIIGLVIISLIPFLVSIVLLYQGTSLLDALKDMPRLVISILPLYVPVVWLAYSTNKKINLSKRLVEEYTHKEVLSKTFEGLSRRINDIDDENISSELKIKLLYNILTVSSENPGKLISDYKTADHPLMDALEKSSKLSEAVDAVSKIPGLSKLTKILEEKSKKLKEEEVKKVEEGLESLSKDS